MQLRKQQRQIHLPLDKRFGVEQPQFLWEALADERPGPEKEFQNLEWISPQRDSADFVH